jgi:hypothetical protein
VGRAKRCGVGGGIAVTALKSQVAALGLRVLAAIAIVWLVFDLTGFGAACDDLLRKQFYAMRGDRATKQRVLLVTVDANTITAWGPPPWRADRINAMFSAIQAGNPRAIGIAGDPRFVMGTEPVPSGVLFDSATGDPTDRMLQAAGLRTQSDAVTNYVGKRGLPTLSAAQVASREIPRATFAGKLVVVGVTAKQYAPVVMTPIGPLTAVQDQAQSLASVADGTSWAVVPGWLRLLVIALMSIVAMIASRKAETIWALVITSALAIGVLVLDYALFATNVALFGATSALAATWVALGFERLRERRVIRQLVAEIGVWTRQRLALASMRVDVSDEQAYWQRVARLAQLYLGCTSTIVAELPANRMRLEVRAIHGTTDSQIADRDLDVRKNPLRTAHLLHTHVWHDSFIAGGTTSTLIVPLVVRGKTIGFWIINFAGRPRDHLQPSHLDLVRTLALELALAMDRRKQQTAIAGDGLLQRLIGRGPLAAELGEIRRHVQWQTQHQQELLALGESMPFGVFVATLWGEIRYMNTAMKDLCSLEGLDPSDTGQSLPDVLCRLTAMQSEDVHDHLRRMVHELSELHLRSRDRDDRPGHDFVLSWLKPMAGTQADAEHLLLVCALPRLFTRQRPREVKPVLAMGRQRPSDDAMTVPVPKTDLADEDEQLAVHHVPTFAAGTPKFERPPTQDEELRNLILPRAAADDKDSLVEKVFDSFVDCTIPLERVDRDE